MSRTSLFFPVRYGLSMNEDVWFEIRLFYIRISPCIIASVPDNLSLRYLRCGTGVMLEINGTRVTESEADRMVLRRDRLCRESSEVTYLSTDSVRVTGSVEFEVSEKEDLILSGNLGRVVGCLENRNGELENDSGASWSMDCYIVPSVVSGSLPCFQPKLGVSAPEIEVFVAGCWSGVPVILTKTIVVSQMAKNLRYRTLDAFPEDEETGKKEKSSEGLILHGEVQSTENGDQNCNSDVKIGNGFYPKDVYINEDGQLSWFNAGVRVGVGIGLGMCLGIGIGVGLLMHSYQTTTRKFRRRFI